MTEPVDSAFRGGLLHLPEELPAGMPVESTVFAADGVTEILTAVCVLAFILSIRRLVNVLQSMLSCLFRWKEAFNLEYNIKLCRDRNIIFYILLLPFCLLVTRYGIYSPEFMTETGTGNAVRLVFFAGIFVIYLLIKRVLGLIFRSDDIDSTAYTAAKRLFLTFFSTAVLCCLALAGILSYTSISDNTVRLVLTYTLSFFYLLLVFRKSQIFSHYCSVLSTILYLCTLEILPTGLLVASAIFL